MLTITTPVEQSAFKRLLGACSSWGTIQSVVQPSPDGVAQAFLIGAAFLADSPAALVLSDNLFHGQDQAPQQAGCQCALGWQPRHRFEEGLAAKVRWFLANQAWWQGMRKRSGYGGQRLGLTSAFPAPALTAAHR